MDKKRHLPTHVLLDHNPGLKVPSIVQLEQIFTIDKRRAQRFAGQASEEEINQIEMAIKVSLGLDLLSSKQGGFMTHRDTHRIMLQGYPDVLNIEQVCEILKIGTKTGYRLLKDGKSQNLKRTKFPRLT